jgi:hypothetical protein
LHAIVNIFTPARVNTGAPVCCVLYSTACVAALTRRPCRLGCRAPTDAATPAFVRPAAAGMSGAIDSGDTAWLLASTGLVFLMTPGLALFYAGLVPARSAATTMAYSLHGLALISPLWLLLTYGAAFGPGPAALGAPGPFSSGWAAPRAGTRVPEAAFCAFQLAFATVTA